MLRILVISLCLWGLINSHSLAQSQSDPESTEQPRSEDDLTDAEMIETLRAALENADAENQTLRSQIARGTLRPSAETSASFMEVVERYNQSWVDYYDHERLLRVHARAALIWQLVAASVVLTLVVVVAGLGVILSYKEVMASIRAPENAANQLKPSQEVEFKNAEEAKAVTKQQTELVMSFQKLQLTSAVTGVVILTLSLAFLFLFLRSVFELDPQDFAAAAEPNADELPIESNNAAGKK